MKHVFWETAYLDNQVYKWLKHTVQKGMFKRLYWRLRAMSTSLILEILKILLGRHQKKSALQPLFQLAIVAGTVFLGTLTFLEKLQIPELLWLVTSSFYLVASILGFAILAYFYFMIKEPDRLQSERFQIEKENLNIAKQKGQESPQLIEDAFREYADRLSRSINR